MDRAILLISCPDAKGINASVTSFIYGHNGNIVHADQHIDDVTNTFFMRIEWELQGFDVEREKIASELKTITAKYQMVWNLFFSDQRQRVALFVSKHLHCLYDLLYRYKAGHFHCDIPLIISNHPDAKSIAGEFGISFAEFAVHKENKDQVEREQREICEKEKIDLIVLARYHQILTEGFVSAYHNRIINIHHSFLPAFIGKNPYAQAYQRGVKVIGATSHYVITQLDQGPIIEQDNVRVSHRDSLDDLIRKGEDLEKVVLSRALRWHLERKILCYDNKTVVFD